MRVRFCRHPDHLPPEVEPVKIAHQAPEIPTGKDPRPRDSPTFEQIERILKFTLNTANLGVFKVERFSTQRYGKPVSHLNIDELNDLVEILKGVRAGRFTLEHPTARM